MTRRRTLTLLACGSLSGCRREAPPAAAPLASVVISEGAVFSEHLHRETRWRVVTLAPGFTGLRLVASGADGRPLRNFARIRAEESAAGRKVEFLMNAGMFESDGTPCGLCIADSREIGSVNLREGEGNFYLKPNGIFFTGPDGPGIVESTEWPVANAGKITCATQSGPLLLRGGERHGQLKEFSPNVNIRNGIGVTSDGHTVLAISAGKVNFFDMAQFFLEVLKCPDALYLDGVVSAMHLPAAVLPSYASGLGPVFLNSSPQ